MKKILLLPILELLLILSLANQAQASWSPDQPFDPIAQVAAQKAVLLLGPTHGAISVVSDVRSIVGLNANLQNSGLGLTASVEDLNRALSNLGAQVTQTQIVVELASDILFDFDKDTIKPEAAPTLKQLAVIILQKGVRAEIMGYTDSKGTDAYNMALSLRRANRVKDWLVQNAGVTSSILYTQGMGAADPVAPNTKPNGSDDPNGRAKNRRVKVVVTTQNK